MLIRQCDLIPKRLQDAPKRFWFKDGFVKLTVQETGHSSLEWLEEASKWDGNAPTLSTFCLKVAAELEKIGK